ncbi:replication protein A 70 kDa DNA-binding subunit [Protopterus annectens]|uniref:replication protein A 70 kDa DNA-binding subunit n=1 Tax=Protopterus annectens TaxID=7888 RepID=UPI001CFB7883|nr:replication protein A 70 kDa DNA-binding subunit [Protopterus annectens]
MAVRLTEGAIACMVRGENPPNPVLQVINIRAIASGNGPPRYRLLMSDGLNTLSSFMLATQLNPMVEDNTVSSNCVCQVNKFIVNTLKDGRRVVVVLDMDVLKTAENVPGKIGNPTPYNEGQGQQQAPVAAPNPPASKVNVPNGFAAEAATSTPVMNRAPAKQFGKPSAVSSTPGGSQVKVVPIASLNPYQSKWTIRARVTNKSQIRTWSNSRGEGKLFSIEMVDESGEIRATAFTDQVDKFFSLIEIGKKCLSEEVLEIKERKRLKSSGLESGLLFGSGELSFVNIIGVCRSYEDVAKITVKSTNREVAKRNIYLMDMSGKIVSVTLWGEDADKFDGSGQPIIAIKGARLSDFGGRSLSILSSSTMILNPDIPESFKLRGWFDSVGQSLEGTSISDQRGGASGGGGNTNWKTLLEVKNENLGHGDKADYYSCIGTVVYLRKENCMYQACPTPECNKKVLDQQNGLYRCEKCDREFPNYKYRMILSANIADFGDNQWVTCFQEAAEAILGQNANYLGELKDTNEQAFEEVFQNANFRSYTFRIRVKLETYNDESRIKATVMDVKPVDYAEYSKRLMMNIRKLASQCM